MDLAERLFRQIHPELDIKDRLDRIERVLQAIADGTEPWKAARAEFPSKFIAPDAIIPSGPEQASAYTIAVSPTPDTGDR